MTKTYLLIDLQNRHPTPEQVTSWLGENGEAWIFFGEQEIGQLGQYMELGSQVSLVDVSKPGKNSLDFHLVLYLGYLVGRREPRARFVILSEDRGYDVAVVHARSKGFCVDRVDTLDLGPVRNDVNATQIEAAMHLQATTGNGLSVASSSARAKKAKTVDEVHAAMLKVLVSPSKPKTLAALRNHIESRFGPDSVPAKVEQVLACLQAAGALKIVDGVLRYPSPAVPEVSGALGFARAVM
ncbi:MAG: hypothetical protein KKC79_00700 [Gammaproteobacteria bacterium]|nr:hypothetical protein [Gammaproteobacteria bacterium]MBU1444483.1 hypothetical protein [Gammaproteobacteria bacterium]MBU2287317.1 hypothetical protein [Gammaproteobacteria bacterium]MBU2407149.1 hypothetical protein [Gammaproteobacteria bacterium]